LWIAEWKAETCRLLPVLKGWLAENPAILNPSSRNSIMTAAETLGTILRKKRLTLATAESCTGGMIGAAITDIAGSSDYFLGGVIAYDNRIKTGVLGVPAMILKRHGAVSGETVIAMAKGAQRLMKTDCAIAVSGVAGPGGGTKEKPVGLVFIGIAVNKKAVVFKCQFTGSRNEIRVKTVEESIRRLIKLLTD
jgi:PncC family amidohydrolase